MGFKRSEARMKQIEAKLRAGMTANGISPKAQEEIILSITSFALYGFPESHAASFALIAYASAYLKCHYLAAFTAALLNNQPMGFYSPATIVKDAQRHGLKLLPVDVTHSEWNCTLEPGARCQYPIASKAESSSCEYCVPSKTLKAISHQPLALESRFFSQLKTRDSQLVQPRQGRRSSAQDASTGEAPENWNESGRDDTFATTIAVPAQEQWDPQLGAWNSRLDSDLLGTGYWKLGTGSLPTPALRMGLRYVRGLREESAQDLIRERAKAPFQSIHDLTRRVPQLRKDELTTLAAIGALNAVGHSPQRHRDTEKNEERFERSEITSASFNNQKFINDVSVSRCLRGENGFARDSRPGARNTLHRRDALWQVERAVRASGPLLEQHAEPDSPSPLAPMNHEERLVADFHGTGLTVGPHPMAYRREWLKAMGIRRACELRELPTGKRLRIGGCVITRQRPGTAKGFVFLSLEDETGVANAIIRPDLFHQNRLLLTSERFLAIEGILQNQDNVISVRAERVQPLFVTQAETASHDFH
jgi:DNA polymerase III alpha subunit